MKANIGTTDRVARIIIGLVLLYLALTQKSAILAVFALFSFFEALVSWCVFYQLIGRNTCPLPNAKRTPLPFFSFWLRGTTILIVAIILNFLAMWVGWSTWYDFLRTPGQSLSLDNYLFLFVIYPLGLGLALNFTKKPQS